MLTPCDQRAIVLTLVRDGMWAMSGRQLRQLQGAYLYELSRPDETGAMRGIYLGVKGAPGSDRPFNRDHHALGWDTEVRPTDTLYIYPMPTPEVARWAEKVLLADDCSGKGSWAGERNKQRYYDAFRLFPLEEVVPTERSGLDLALLS